jgi:hypothetical protein
MDSQEGIGRTFTCMCQINGQTVCVDLKLLGTTEDLRQKRGILVFLHDYGWFLGAYITVI